MAISGFLYQLKLREKEFQRWSKIIFCKLEAKTKKTSPGSPLLNERKLRYSHFKKKCKNPMYFKWQLEGLSAYSKMVKKNFFFRLNLFFY